MTQRVRQSELNTYRIPQEYIGHYEGRFGECDYDTRVYEIGNEEGYPYLHYIENSGLAPVLPEGYTSCYRIFSDCMTLTSLDLSIFDTS